jgi:hypothetical protein
MKYLDSFLTFLSFILMSAQFSKSALEDDASISSLLRLPPLSSYYAATCIRAASTPPRSIPPLPPITIPFNLFFPLMLFAQSPPPHCHHGQYPKIPNNSILACSIPQFHLPWQQATYFFAPPCSHPLTCVHQIISF